MDPVFMITSIFQLLVFVIGVPGNLLILQVFRKKTRKTSTNVLIMALASADIMACLLRPMHVGYFMTHRVTGNYPSIYIEIVYFPLNIITVYSSTLLTAAIAFDRYDAVCRPHTRLLSYRKAQGLAVCCFLVSLPMTVPTVLVYYYRMYVSVRLSKPACTLSVYVAALISVLIFYVRVYKAVLFRSKVRTKWGGRFAGISTVGETSVTVTGHTEVSALPTTREKVVQQTDNHMEQDDSSLKTQTDTANPAPTTETEIVCVNDERKAVVYHNLCIMSSSSDTQPTDPKQPPEYISLSPASNPSCPPATPGTSSNTVSNSVSTRGYSQVPSSSNQPERSGSTVKQRSASEKGKSCKTVAARMQNRTTRMLLLTTIVFLVSWIPYMILAVLQIHAVLRPDTKIDQTLVSIITNSSVLLYVNSAANPFIYVLANRQFRNDCKRELRKLWRSCSRR